MTELKFKPRPVCSFYFTSSLPPSWKPFVCLLGPSRGPGTAPLMPPLIPGPPQTHLSSFVLPSSPAFPKKNPPSPFLPSSPGFPCKYPVTGLALPSRIFFQSQAILPDPMQFLPFLPVVSEVLKR